MKRTTRRRGGNKRNRRIGRNGRNERKGRKRTKLDEKVRNWTKKYEIGRNRTKRTKRTKKDEKGRKMTKKDEEERKRTKEDESNENDEMDEIRLSLGRQDYLNYNTIMTKRLQSQWQISVRFLNFWCLLPFFLSTLQ